MEKGCETCESKSAWDITHMVLKMRASTGVKPLI